MPAEERTGKNNKKATNIKWDVTDGAEKMSEEKTADALSSLPTEVELPEKFNKKTILMKMDITKMS